MITIENIDTSGWEAAIRSMRNPMSSWSRSDSRWTEHYGIGIEYEIGPKDLELAKRLVNAGTEHAKFLRMINVTFDMTAPFYLLKEMDTYKVGTTCNSCSTMHKLTAKPFELSDFSLDGGVEYHALPKALIYEIVDELNRLREVYLETKDKTIWRAMVQILPESYNQKRTYSMNYAVIRNIVHQREGHKLSEWATFIEAMEKNLPYYKELILGDSADE